MDWRKIVLMTGIGVVVYAGIKYLLPPAIPFLLGWFLAASVLPVAKWIEKTMKIRRGIAGGILIGILTVISALGIWKLSVSVVSQTKHLIINIKGWETKINRFLDSCCYTIENYTGICSEDIHDFLLYQVGRMQEELQNKLGIVCLDYMVTWIKGGIVLIGGVIVMIIFGTLVIKDMEMFREKINQGKYTGRLADIWRKICYAGGRYLKTQCILMILISILCVIGFWILGNPYFAVAGIVVGILDALPLIGAGTILIPWAVLWLIEGEYLKAMGYLLLYFAADLTRQFLEPRILGKEIGLHPAVLLISVYGGFYLYGFGGFFLGPVTVLILQVVWEEITIFNKKDIKNLQKS